MAEELRVGVLYDSLSDNIGDAAMLDAARDGLAPHGITDVSPVRLLSAEPQVFDAVIVGGGELIRPHGDPFYDRFRYAQGFMLHAVGVWDSADDLDFLLDYQLVAARTEAETGYLRARGLDAFTTPCPTTIMHAEYVDLPEARSGRRNAVHLVPTTLAAVPHAVEIVNEIPGDHLLMPFTRYNGDRDFMRALPLKGNETTLPDDLSARQMRSVIAQSDFVVASSLHMTLFALANGIPFVSYRQPKVFSYLKDRQLEDLTFDDDQSLVDALNRAQEAESRIRAARDQDVAQCTETFATLARALKRYDGPSVELPPTSLNPVRDEQKLLLKQATLVRQDRDRLINTLFMRNLAITNEKAMADDRVLNVEGRAEALRAEVDRLQVVLDAFRRPTPRNLRRALRDRRPSEVRGKVDLA